ncbi:molybdopterin-dependent oxidoreductase [Candidimonas humi]|uniref:Molybdopterin-dependent oxidoreductase n=1 Tax=Candidimonas humi TaxID=683355 RepID=A0ABV8NV95_9BURK|nr:nitrate reductase [Candidimonas humi]MBV6307071.1 molybdopterin-dependent oxidoreductase [Candidimonas humi]
MKHVSSPSLAPPVRTVASVCCYCGTGCGVQVRTQGERVIEVAGDESHPSSHGRLCTKGMNLAATVRRDASRVLTAQLRRNREEERRPIALHSALSAAARRLAQTLRQHGPQAIGLYLSGQLLTEDYAVFNKLARALIGTNNIDTNSRLCMSSAVSGYVRTLGADAPPACYEDLDHAKMVFIAGSNMAYAHPVLFRRLEAAKARDPSMKIVVVDPRRTDTCEIADLHLQISAGTDVALMHAMLNVLIWEDLVDRDYIARHTEGFEALKRRVHEYTPRAAQEICGVPAEDIVRCARWFGSHGPALSLYTMGLNQSSSGTAKNAALIHLHLATGQIGKPGAGPFSLTGQPNAMGGREAGGMATLLPGHRDPGDAAHRAQVAAAWGVDSLPDTPGLTAVEMFDAVLEGKVKVLWIAGTNPAQSLPNQAKVRAALRRAEFVIVQEAYANTETLEYADLVLPAATWPEKDGTMTNSERRVSRVRTALRPPGDARPDWQLACAVARRLAAEIAPAKAPLFRYRSAAEIFAEHARLTAGRDLDYSALSHALLDSEGPQQWPFAPQGAACPRLYADGVFPTSDGRARFMDVAYTPVAERPTARRPLRLTTGRLRDQWHTMSRSGLVPQLARHVEEPCIHLHPQDMERLKIAGEQLVEVQSERGALVAPAQPDPALKPGHVYMPMHWGSGYMAGDGVNALGNDAVDPLSHQPELKHSAVSVRPLDYAWQASAWMRGAIPELRPRLASWLRAFPYAVLVPSTIGGEGVRLRLAAPEAPQAAVLERLAADLELERPDMAFDDPARGVLRRLRRGDGQLQAFLLAGDLRAQTALLAWAEDGKAPEDPGRALMGRMRAAARARIVCACHGVGEDAIAQAIQAGQTLEDLQSGLKCGTACGSCVPQLKRMLREHGMGEIAA